MQQFRQLIKPINNLIFKQIHQFHKHGENKSKHEENNFTDQPPKRDFSQPAEATVRADIIYFFKKKDIAIQFYHV
jgi:hypothetical protein